ncbi:MAG: glycosyltransferase [Methylococcaceae bacterium]
MAKPLKVLHVIYALSGGGAERQLQLLLKNAKNSTTHGVLCVEPRDAELSSLGAEIFVHQRQGKFDFGLYLTCYKTIKSFQPDVVHLWLPAVITIPAMLTAALLKKSIIFSYRRRMNFFRLLSVLEYIFALFLVKKVISNNAVSQSTGYYQLLYKHKSGVTIANGLDFSVIHKKTDHQVKVDKPINMIFVGRLVQEKNILNLVRALAGIPKNKQWKLDVFGEGDLQQQTMDLVKQLDLEKNIIFHGFEKSIYLKLAQSDLLLMPSNTEGMPNVLVEALATTIPVVASNIPSIIDIVSDTGAVILVESDKVESITKGIVTYMDHQNTYIENTSIGLRISKKFDVASMSEKYNEQYNSLLHVD